jgi:3-methylcrotonyl-CoA carboxylase alpha subunit
VLSGRDISVFSTRAYHFRIPDPLDRSPDAAASGNVVLSPMPGLVKAMFVSPGQSVSAGDDLCVLEAMKMEHRLTASRDGVVAEVLACAGDQVQDGAALVVLEEAVA